MIYPPHKNQVPTMSNLLDAIMKQYPDRDYTEELFAYDNTPPENREVFCSYAVGKILDNIKQEASVKISLAAANQRIKELTSLEEKFEELNYLTKRAGEVSRNTLTRNNELRLRNRKLRAHNLKLTQALDKILTASRRVCYAVGEGKLINIVVISKLADVIGDVAKKMVWGFTHGNFNIISTLPEENYLKGKAENED